MGKRRDQLNEFYSGMRTVSKMKGKSIQAFNSLLKTETEDGALSFKIKELMSVSIACFARCEYCIVYHSYSAMKAGATKEEVIEAGLMSVVFGGGPAISYVVTVLNDCIEEFHGDFN